jgi:hypothetical protein
VYPISPSLSGLNLYHLFSRQTLEPREHTLFDGKLPYLPSLSLRFVNSPIGTAADEADDLIAFVNTFPGIRRLTDHGHLGRIRRIYAKANEIRI